MDSYVCLWIHMDPYGFLCVTEGQAEETLSSGPIPCRGFPEAFRIGPLRGPVHISVPLCSFRLFCFQGFLWIPMDSYVFLWITIEFLWFPTDSYAFL